jgi:hypothetical protein
VRCSCSVRATPAPLALHADGTFSRPGGLLQCASGSTALVPAEVGAVTPARRRRLRLATTNLTDVTRAIEQCGSELKIRKHSAWVRVDDTGGRLRGAQVQRIKVPDVPLFLETTVRFRGEPTLDGTAAAASVPTERCTRSLVDCLRRGLSD